MAINTREASEDRLDINWRVLSLPLRGGLSRSLSTQSSGNELDRGRGRAHVLRFLKHDIALSITFNLKLTVSAME